MGTVSLPSPTPRGSRGNTGPRPVRLNVNEAFGPTIQGEGRHAGQLCSFLRLTGCNLTCSWCDTPYTWDWDRFDKKAETHPVEVQALADTLAALPGRLVVSGGEPLMQRFGLSALLALLPQDRPLDLETNGTRDPGDTADRWATITCSPKIIPSAGQDTRSDIPVGNTHPAILERADFKFVVQSAADLRAVDEWVEEHPSVTPDRVWLMPEGTSADVLTERTPWTMDSATERGFNFSSRLHVYGWHEVRGH